MIHELTITTGIWIIALVTTGTVAFVVGMLVGVGCRTAQRDIAQRDAMIVELESKLQAAVEAINEYVRVRF